MAFVTIHLKYEPLLAVRRFLHPFGVRIALFSYLKCSDVTFCNVQWLRFRRWRFAGYRCGLDAATPAPRERRWYQGWLATLGWELAYWAGTLQRWALTVGFSVARAERMLGSWHMIYLMSPMTPTTVVSLS